MMNILRYFITGIIVSAGFHQLFAQAETQNPNSAAGLYWRVKGNAGTNTSTNFIGTTDNVGLWFRTNNQVRMIIDSIGRVGIGTIPRFRFNVVGSGADTVLADFTHSPIFAEMMNQSSIRVKSGPALFTATLNSANALEILSGYGTNTLISRGINLVNASSSEVNYGIRNLANGGGMSVTDSVIGIHSITSGGVRNIAMRGGAITSGTANTQNIGVQGFASGATDNWAGYFGNNAVGDGLVFIKDALSIGAANPVAELYVGGLGANVVIDAVGTGGGAVAASTSTTDRLLYANTNGYVKAIPSGSAGDVLALSSNGPTWVSPTLGAWSLSGNNAGASDFIGTTNTESFRFRTNNIQRMVITSGGFVGIGTALPLYKFHMTDTSSNTTMASLNHVHTGSSGAPTGLLVTATNTGTAGILYGTYSQTLNSATAAETNALAAFNPSTGTTNRGIRAWALGSTTGTNYGIQAYASNAGTNWAGYFGFSTAGDGKVYVKDTLAINTTLPARRFHMAGTTSGMRYGGVATGGSFITTPSAGTDKIMYADAAGDIRAMSGGTTGQVLTYTTSGPAWSTAASNDWGLTGNASTVDGTNFIGTTDNVAFNFRVNSQKAGRIGTASDGNVFLGYQAGLNDNLLNNGNTFIGYQAGRTNSTGSSNSALGIVALYSNTSGTSNTAVGSVALFSNSTGNSNTATGYAAMENNTTGSDNTAAGDEALRSNTTGIGNVAVGRATLYTNTTGSQNIALGFLTLINNISGNNNIALGTQALGFNTTGYSNVAVGTQALFSNTTKNNLVAIGDSALFRNGTGVVNAIDATQNVAVGSKALLSNTLGYGNTAIGFLAARANTTASGNVAVGDSALFTNTTGSGNVAIGRNALATTNGRFGQVAVGDSALALSQPATFLPNTALGYKAMARSAGGYQNVAVGSFSGYRNTDGFENTWVGYSAGQNNTTAVSNTYIGTQSGQSTNTGSSNAGVGSQSLFNNTSGYGNVAAGHSAGLLNLTGYRNTLVGDSADVLVNNLNAASAFGYFAKVSASNTIILGDTIGRPQVGIGVTAVGKTLSNAIFEIAAETANANVVHRVSGSVAPAHYFQRSSGTLAAPTAVVNGSSTGAIQFQGYHGTDYSSTAAISSEVDSALNGTIVPGRLRFFTRNGIGSLSERVRIDRRGYVGIDETNPRTTLHVNGGTDAQVAIVESGYVMIGNELGSNLLFDDNEIMCRNNSAVSTLNFNAEGGAIWAHSVTASNADDFYVSNDANVEVGIGVGQFPAYQLELALNSAAKPTSTLWTVPSDERLKTNIAPFTEGLQQVLQIKPVWYSYNGKAGLPTTERGVGTLAAELEKVAPHMIKPFIDKDENGQATEYKSVDYNAMLFMFVNSFKEQQQKIDELKKQIQELRHLLQNR